MLIKHEFLRIMGLTGKLAPVIALVLLMSFSTIASAALVAVVLSEDAAPYHETANAIESALGPEHAVIKVLASKLSISDSALSRASLLLTVGIHATEMVVDRGGKTPLLAVLVTEDWYRKQGASRLGSGERNAGVLVLEQPLARQFRLIHSAFPSANKVGVVLSRKNAQSLEDLKVAAASQRFALISGVVDSEDELVNTLGKVLAETDLLLALPDAEVLNRNTIQSMLMTSYRFRDPVVGYSKAMVRAGALVSLYSTPAQIGRQAGEIAAKSLAGTRLPRMVWPKYFSVSVNPHVARSLGIDIQSEDNLMDSLGADE